MPVSYFLWNAIYSLHKRILRWSPEMKNIHWLCGPEQAKVLLLGFKPCKIGKSQNTPGAVRTGKSPVLTALSLPTNIFHLLRLDSIY